MLQRIMASISLLIAIVVTSGTTSAQDTNIERLYGQGVHAYFNGEFDQAIEYLNKSIEAGSSDARAYYFRGLANHQLGKTDASKADFVEGAKLEQMYENQVRTINRSLTRIQGTIRLSLEKSRQGVFAGNTKTVTISKTKMNVSSPLNPTVIDSSATDLPKPNLPDSSKIADPTSPFPEVSGTAPKSEKPRTMEPELTKPANPADGLFGDDSETKVKPADIVKPVTPPVVEPQPEAPKTTEKPPVATPEAKGPATEKADSKNVFGDSKPATPQPEKGKMDDAPKTKEPPKGEPKDIFGDSANPKADESKPADKPAEKKPTEEPQESGGDIFGDSKSADQPTEKKPATESKKSEGDIFGDSKPADKPAEKTPPQKNDDIFGDSKPADKKPADKKPEKEKKADAAGDIFGDTKPADSTKKAPAKKAPQKKTPKKKDVDDIFGDG